MNFTSLLYELLSGPCLYITVPLCIAGLARRFFLIRSGRRNGMLFPVFDSVIANRKRRPGDILLFAVSSLFHIALLAAPLTAAAHLILFDLGWDVALPHIPQSVTGVFTVTAVVTGLMLMARRVLLKHVLAVSSWRDFALMALVLAPFITGYMARTGSRGYEAVMIIHCVTAHMLIVAAGWTRLGHFLFYAAGRLPVQLFSRGAGA